MSRLSERLQEQLEQLKPRRDELRVQLDLGKKEARDAWDEFDEKWQNAEARIRQLGREARETADEVGDAAQEVVDDAGEGIKLTAEEVGDAAEKLMGELKEGFERLRRLV